MEVDHCPLPDTPEAIEEAANLSALAFEDNPCYRYVYGSAADNPIWQWWPDGGIVGLLSFIFARNFWLRRGTGCNRCTLERGTSKVVCFFMFVPPTVHDPSMADMVRAGMLGLPLWFGLGRLQRLLQTKDWFEAAGRRVMQGRKAIRLERMTVLPAYQGKGIGTAALRHALQDADAAGLPVILFTQEPRNVTFYGRLGFEVVEEARYEPAGALNWCMIREPAAAPPPAA